MEQQGERLEEEEQRVKVQQGEKHVAGEKNSRARSSRVRSCRVRSSKARNRGVRTRAAGGKNKRARNSI